MAGAQIGRVIVSVADLDRSVELYGRVLGLTLLYRSEDVAMLVFAGEAGMQLLLHRRHPSPSPAGVAVSFRVEDVDAIIAAACAAGARVVDEPSDQAWGERQAVLTDCDGHIFCLTTPLAG